MNGHRIIEIDNVNFGEALRDMEITSLMNRQRRCFQNVQKN